MELFKRDLIQKDPSLKKDRRRLNRQVKKLFIKSPLNKKSKEEQVKFQKQLRENNYGVYSLTKDPYNIVMWSHYSNDHKGFCVGFDTEMLIKFFENYFISYQKLIELYEVTYIKKFPKLVRSNLSNDEVVFESVFNKSKFWDYEKEWRLIALSEDNPNFPVILDRNLIKEIILGCNIYDLHKEEIINIIKEKHYKLNLYQATIKSDSFGLEFNKINYIDHQYT